MNNKNKASKVREDNPNQLESNRKSALLARYNRLKLIYSSHRVKTEILFKEAYGRFFNSKYDMFREFFQKLINKGESEAMDYLKPKLTPDDIKTGYTPNQISTLCYFEEDAKGLQRKRGLQKDQFADLLSGKYIIAILSEGKNNRVWLPINENNFLEALEAVFKIEADGPEMLYAPFFIMIDSEINMHGALEAKFPKNLFEDFALGIDKICKIVIAKKMTNLAKSPPPSPSAMMYAAPSPVKLASPTMAFFTQNLTSNPITLIDFKEKIAIKIQDKTLHVMGLFSDKLIEFLKECKHILNKNKKDEILLVSPNAKEDEDTTTQILTLYSVLFMLNPNFINDLFHPKM